MVEGKKSVLFWIGLIVLGYSISQLFAGVWQLVYFFLVYPSFGSADLGMLQALAVVPLISTGVIFLVIGVYLMKVGTEKIEPVLEEPEEENLE